MKIIIRADASVDIGTGHIMRCLTLAEDLRKRKAEVAFICREMSGNCIELVMNQGFPVFRLPGIDEFDAVLDAELVASLPCLCKKPDWLIVDHYNINAEWELRIRPTVGRIMVIDDLANRSHDCDILLDQNLFENMQWRYHNLTPSGCRQFLGPRYALLRDEFIETRRTLRARDGIVHRILIFFGGSDPTNETEKALLALNQLNCQDINVDVVVGSANPNGDKIQRICTVMTNVTFHRQVANMATLMANADLALGAGGTTTWERCFLGLPTLVVVVADNQEKPAQATDHAGLARVVGESSVVTVDVLAAEICEALRKPSELVEMSKRCLSFMGQRNASVNSEILTLFERSR